MCCNYKQWMHKASAATGGRCVCVCTHGVSNSLESQLFYTLQINQKSADTKKQ